jgi:hypothetical protein
LYFRYALDETLRIPAIFGRHSSTTEQRDKECIDRMMQLHLQTRFSDAFLRAEKSARQIVVFSQGHISSSSSSS